jgi:Tfp pilus assembly protein PilV
MFSLIITLVAIVLVAVLALATIYYGGSAFRQGGDAAEAARIVNEGQQVRAALTLYDTTKGAPATSMQALVDAKALQSAPAGWDVIDGYTYRPATTQKLCLAVNQKQGVNLIPTCGDAQYANSSLCCSVSS